MSPAGSYEGIVAAVQAGADAVYFGAGEFNARRNARNLGAEELPEAMRYCRLRGVKTYITVNTLVTDRELLAAKELVLQLAAWGADALIIQDLGMARMVRALVPDMPIFASTQMAIHNLPGALAAQRLGFSRVVLARELPLEQIAFIAKRTELEVEVFTHGALCMGYSGLCYFSSAVGGRSGNRGLCAQPCRMPYTFFGSRTDPYLSLKDLCAGNHLKALEEAGVKSFKIEGRMKRPEYTAMATQIYRRAIDSGQPIPKEDMVKLETLFSRSGFTDGYLTGQKGESMFGARSEADRHTSRSLYKEAQQIYQKEPERPCVRVDFAFTARAGEAMRLEAIDQDGLTYESQSTVAEAAQTRATAASEVAGYLQKTGGTVFYPGTVKVNLDKDLRVAPGAVNAMRRTALEALTAMRRKVPGRETFDWQPGLQRLPFEGDLEYIFSFLKLEQVTPGILERRPALIYLPLMEMVKQADMVGALISHGQDMAPAMPRIVWDSEWPEVLLALKKLKGLGVTSVLCSNISQLELLRPLGFALRGDHTLNIMNSQSMKELKSLGAGTCAVSFEMNLAQIRDLSQTLPCELLAYGRLPLMITENCVIRRRTGNCTCEGTGSALIDKTGRSFPLMPEEKCRTAIYNADKLYLADKAEELKALGVRWLRLSFTTENHKECAAIVSAYLDGEAAPPKNLTRGLYFRGVE